VTIIADRGLFVRLLMQSGKFERPDAEALADAVDAATRQPASSEEVQTLRAELLAVKSDVALILQRMDFQDKRTDERLEALQNKLLVRLGGLMIAVAGLLFAALRLTN
jgi:uncharacterized protein YdcH (DUF465 family)